MFCNFLSLQKERKKTFFLKNLLLPIQKYDLRVERDSEWSGERKELEMRVNNRYWMSANKVLAEFTFQITWQLHPQHEMHPHKSFLQS